MSFDDFISKEKVADSIKKYQLTEEQVLELRRYKESQLKNNPVFVLTKRDLKRVKNDN